MLEDQIFEILILIGRPAAGKSEILDYLTGVDAETLSNHYHLGHLDVIDDFPMLWTWFEEDNILSEKFGVPRLHSDRDEYFIYPYLWNLLVERIDLEYKKRTRDNNHYHQGTTTILEFSRGVEHGGYQQAFEHLSDQVLERAGILYVQVSYAESKRKNRRRFNPERPDSILEHALDDEKLEKLYRYDDWQALLSNSSSDGTLAIREYKVPFMVFDNEDDVTTKNGVELEDRLKHALQELWERLEQVKKSEGTGFDE